MEQQHAPATAEADHQHPHRDDNSSSSSNNNNQKIEDPQILSPVSTNTAVHKDSALPPIPEPAHDTVATPTAGGLKSRLQLSANRLLSLDLLRGLAILIMITCNAQMDNAFWIVTHPEWIGFTIADTVFPSFLFITGCTLPLSVRADPNPTPGNKYYRNHALRILKRSLIIWGLGVILNLYGLVQLHAPADQFRWPGVLNRIGFCYLVVGWMHLLVLAKGRKDERPLSVGYLFRSSNKAVDTVDGGKRVEEEVVEHGAWPWFVRVTLPFYLPVVCLVVWLICTYSVQVEGCPYRAMIEDPKCSPQAYFDLKVFGKNHTYRHLEFDPEGSLSTLTSILNVWFGWYIGCTVRTLNAQVKQVTSDFKAHRETTSASGTAVSEAQVLEEDILEQETLVRIHLEHCSTWFWYGLLWAFIGWLFSLGLPLSKPSWTATFAVMSSGVSQTALAVLFYKFDAQPKAERLKKLHRDHQAYLSNNQLSHHHRPLPLDSEHSSTDRGNYSSALALYFKADHFLRHWFRRSVIVVLGSMGRNAILMYMCSELVQGTCSLIPGGPTDPVTGEKSPDLCTSAFQHTWGALDIGGWASLFYSLGFAALHVLLAIYLDHKKWYFKV
ncbi:hypothetical protein KI688_008782 [Linnemannia hyalina]|uniref:Heparan-alpha-glucosaminide N-acetyltransferase catalytic domain-containing protein n=1 Tax=Linnemannia hyalina TaxID=64524 RepID=A0A9P7Y4M6_9FUNG|nr:hypothetical protein KI688_008782 [Linnemannia hyalina]